MSLLFTVRDFVRGQGTATASQIAGSLQLPRTTVEDALLHWQRRGQIEVVEPAMSGGSCSTTSSSSGCGKKGCGGASCGTSAPQPMQAYRWQGPAGL